MGVFGDEPIKKVPAHTIGQDLALLSVGDLTERIALLKREITRLETDMAAKAKSKSAAESIFRR